MAFGTWYITYQEGKQKTRVNPEAAVILAKNKWTGPDKTVSEANSIFEAERAEEARKIDSGEKKKPTETATAAGSAASTTPMSFGKSEFVDNINQTLVIPAEEEPNVVEIPKTLEIPADPSQVTSAVTLVGEEERWAELVHTGKAVAEQIPPVFKGGALKILENPPAEWGPRKTPEAGAGTTPTATPTDTTTAPVAQQQPPTTPATPTPAVVATPSETTTTPSTEEEIFEVMVTATPRKIKPKPTPVVEQPSAVPVEPEDVKMGEGINYGEAVKPSTMTIEGFNPKDYPDQYYPSLRAYLAGTNIGSAKARKEAEVKAAEDVKQLLLSGSLRPKGKTKLIPVQTTFEALTPQTQFQQPSAEAVSPIVPAITPPTQQAPLPPPPEPVAETDPAADEVEARVASLEQQVVSAMQATNSLGQSTSQLGKKVATNTMAMDNMKEFRTARNLDDGVSEYRRV